MASFNVLNWNDGNNNTFIGDGDVTRVVNQAPLYGIDDDIFELYT